MNKEPLIEVFLSDCTLENEPDLLRSTLKAGQIARTLAIYKVNRVNIYRGKKSGECSRLGDRLEKLLRYMVIPPYLKKKAIPKSRIYSYVGLSPPLQIDTHIVSETPVIGEIRIGLVKKKKRDLLIIDAGLKSDIEVPLEGLEEDVSEKSLVALVYDGNKWRILKDKKVYLGFEVFYYRDLDIVSLMKRFDGLRIGTSRIGKYAWEETSVIVNRLKVSKRIGVVFGEPYRGLKEIVSEAGSKVDEVFDLYLNFIPYQGTKSVRVEEALIAVLQTIIFLNHAYRSI